MKFFLGIFFLFVQLLFAQKDTLKYKTDEITVTALRQTDTLFKINKNIEVFGTDKIKTAAVNNPQDMLNYSNSVQLNQRGTNGVQADVAIRGGTFEQTLILLDGIKIIDPQTGHHNLNLPVTMLNVEQIEIVKGNSSNINGANAFGGLINFRTKRNRYNSFAAQIEGGDFGLYSASLFGSYNIGKLSNNVAFERSHSNGYRKNTKYDINSFSYGGSFATNKTVLDVFLGYTDKAFGANGFYTVKFPEQYEHTKTTFAKASAEFGNGNLTYSTKIYWRNNNDEFLLDRTNPAFYKNNHTTNIYGGEISAFVKSGIGKTVITAEFVYDEITSNNLGNHNRNRSGLFILHQFRSYKNFSVGVSGYLHNYSTVGVKLIPGIDIGYSPDKRINLFANYSAGVRIPTYTELFYNSPTTHGNSGLTYEKTDNYELGIKYFADVIKFSAVLFFKNSSDLIDWVVPIPDAPWQAMNIAKLKTGGAEFNLSFDFQRMFLPINTLELKYTYLKSDYKNGGLPSAYLLNSFRHQAIISFDHYLPLDIDVYWNMRYENRFDGEEHFITDVKINRMFTYFTAYLKITNLFSTGYYDYLGVPLPGRWAVAGIKFSM